MAARIDIRVEVQPRSAISGGAKGTDVWFEADEDCTLCFHDASMFGVRQVDLTAHQAKKETIKLDKGRTFFYAIAAAKAAAQAPSSSTTTTTGPTTKSISMQPMGGPNEIVVP
jgi:hypothetical protein